MIDEAQLAADAEYVGVPKELYKKWYHLNLFFVNFIPKKYKFDLQQVGNGLEWKDFSLKVNFVNNTYLQATLEKGSMELLTIRVPEGEATYESASAMSTQIALSIKSYEE